MTSCPVCQYPSGQYFQKAGEYKIFKCSFCGLEYTLPIPSDDFLARFYADYQDDHCSDEILRLNAIRNRDSLLEFGYIHAAPVLDFGTGGGTFVVQTLNCLGVDFGDKIPDGPFNFITLWGVLEHLARPIEVLSDLAVRLNPTGKIALTTVWAESEIPYFYKPPEHLTYWTGTALDLLAHSAGLRMIEDRPYTMVQDAGKYLERVLSRTPEEYRERIAHVLPEIVEVPTNEVFCVMKKR